MANIIPLYIKHHDLSIRFIEAQAIRKFIYNGNAFKMYENHEDIEKGWAHWAEAYSSKASQNQRALMKDLNSGVYQEIDSFYDSLKELLKPKPRGKALKDKKKRTSQKAFQKESLGDAFIDNNQLISEAKKASLDLADANADQPTIILRAKVLAELYSHDAPLTDEQLQTLIDLMNNQIDKHLKLDRIEAKILDQNNKNLYFMYGKIKRKVTVSETIELGLTSASKLCGCSRTDVKPILKELEKLGFIKCIQKGKQGSTLGRSSIYRREH